MAPKSLLASDVSSLLRFPDPFGVAWITMSTCTLSQTEDMLERLASIVSILTRHGAWRTFLTRQGGRVELGHPSQTFTGPFWKLNERRVGAADLISNAQEEEVLLISGGIDEDSLRVHVQIDIVFGSQRGVLLARLERYCGLHMARAVDNIIRVVVDVLG
jgi:hypothetical protein